MTDHWARKFGYTEEEILEKDHITYDLDIFEAIKMGIVNCPEVVNCVYNLKSELEDLKFTIDEIKNDELKDEKLKKYEELRRTKTKNSRIAYETDKTNDAGIPQFGIP